MKPYFYRLLCKLTGEVYVGSQYGKSADPSNLLKTYFTSSKKVRGIIQEHGVDAFEITYIKERTDARSYEARYLKHAYKLLGSASFAKRFLNRNIAPGILQDEETIKKANKKRKVSNSLAAKRRVENGTHNFIGNKRQKSKEELQLLSELCKKNKPGQYRKMTEELKAKLSETSKGNTNVRGYRWWTDGVIYKRSKEQPGEGFYYGSPPQSAETKAKRSAALKGKPKTEEHKQKLRKQQSDQENQTKVD